MYIRILKADSDRVLKAAEREPYGSLKFRP